MVGARDFLDEEGRLGDTEVECAVRTQPHDAKVIVAHHDGIGGAPFVAGEEAGGHEEDVGLERDVEGVLPRLQFGEDGDVVGDERVFAWREQVAELAQIHELRRL